MASALVLRRDAQDVSERSYASEDSDAFAGTGLGRHPDGSSARPEATCFPALRTVGKSASRVAGWLSFLSGRQFCRGQKSRSER